MLVSCKNFNNSFLASYIIFTNFIYFCLHNYFIYFSQRPLNTSQDLKDNFEGRYKVMAQYGEDNSLETFCNASDATHNGTYILNKIMAGYKAVYGQRCNPVFDVSLSKDFGWDWQV